MVTLNRILRNTSFRTFLLCGSVGILVDVDHVIAYYAGLDGRFLHTPLFAISSFVLLCLGTYIAGLYFRVVLKR